jgi:hypothetical protein
MSGCREEFADAMEGLPCLWKPFTIQKLLDSVREALAPKMKRMTSERAGKARKLKSG